MEKLESLQEHVISRFPEYQQLVFEGIYEDTTEMELLLDVIRNLINSHRNFLSRIHMNPKDVTTNFLKLVLELEKSIFLYVVSIKKLGEFFDIEWLQIPLFRLEEYLDSVYVQTNMPASVNRVGFLCEYLSILDFTK